MVTEIELKLKLSPLHFEQFKQHPLLRQTQQQAATEYLRTTYFDTPDYELRQRGYVLRIREFSNSLLQTIKTSGASDNGLHERQEWEHEVKTLTPDYSFFPDVSLRQELIETALGQKIIPLFTTNFWRTRWLLQNSDYAIEVALDKGYAEADNKQDDFCEIELELKQGDKANIYEIAQQLSQSFDLTPENLSKAGRGYRLLKTLV